MTTRQPKAIVPFFARGRQFSMKNTTDVMPRVLQHTASVIHASSELLLPWYPHADGCVEVYLNGSRLFDYAVAGRMIFFEEPLAGFFEFVSEDASADVPHALRVPLTLSAQRDVGTESVIVLRALNGHVRLSKDRRHAEYTPNVGFSGTDTFACALLSCGDISPPECFYITVT